MKLSSSNSFLYYTQLKESKNLLLINFFTILGLLSVCRISFWYFLLSVYWLLNLRERLLLFPRAAKSVSMYISGEKMFISVVFKQDSIFSTRRLEMLHVVCLKIFSGFLKVHYKKNNSNSFRSYPELSGRTQLPAKNIIYFLKIDQ